METDKTSVEYRVITVIADQLQIDRTEIELENRFKEDLNADSLDTVEIIMKLEDEFDTKIPDEEAQEIKTVSEAIDYIRSRFPAVA